MYSLVPRPLIVGAEKTPRTNTHSAFTRSGTPEYTVLWLRIVYGVIQITRKSGKGPHIGLCGSINNTWPEAIFVYFTRNTLFTNF